MSDFFLDLRPTSARRVAAAARHLKWFPDIRVQTIELPSFSLVTTRCGDLGLWGTFHDSQTGVLVALNGRVALDEASWHQAEAIPGQGGLAAKLLWHRYVTQQPLVELLNGAFTILICDPARSRVTLVTDQCGMCPVYASEDRLVFSSHPDLLASTTGQSDAIDKISLAEFLTTARVSFPHTYYERLRALQPGVIYEFLLDGKPAPGMQRVYFEFSYNPVAEADEPAMVQQFADAFCRAVNRRSLRRLGKTAVALSGGLDSRTLLCSAAKDAEVVAFTFFDKENYEYQIASRIAKTKGVPLIPLRREFEHYALCAAQGVRIQGGMGSFGNNHFLRFRERIMELGVGSLLSGFYCDYLFKGLGLDKVSSKLTGTDRLGAFSLQWYRPRFVWPTELCRLAVDRHRAIFAGITDRDSSDLGRLQTEGRRLFPLAYEPDNAETVIAQRVFPWFLPTVDADLIAIYQKLTPALKLNNRIYSQVVRQVCGPKVSAIPDSNTRLAVGRRGLPFIARHLAGAATRRIRRVLCPSMHTAGSWPDWEYYVHHSPVLEEIWKSKPGSDESVIEEILGNNLSKRDLRSFSGQEVELPMRVLTLRLWFRNRIV